MLLNERRARVTTRLACFRLISTVTAAGATCMEGKGGAVPLWLGSTSGDLPTTASSLGMENPVMWKRRAPTACAWPCAHISTVYKRTTPPGSLTLAAAPARPPAHGHGHGHGGGERRVRGTRARARARARCRRRCRPSRGEAEAGRRPRPPFSLHGLFLARARGVWRARRKRTTTTRRAGRDAGARVADRGACGVRGHVWVGAGGVSRAVACVAGRGLVVEAR